MQRARGGEQARARHRGGSFEGGAHTASVDDVVRWGTSGGAAVLGLPGLGAIEPGQAADIAVYALDDPRYFGLHDAAIGPVASGGRPTLRLLTVAGAALVENDVVRGVDLGELAHQARQAVRRLTA
jgi:cytosine/adenosine deaminase-related metal-dependent hydrolase